MTVHVIGPTAFVVSIRSNPANMAISGTTTISNLYNLPGDGLYKTVSVYFVDVNTFGLDPGPIMNTSVTNAANVGTGNGLLFRNITGTTLNLRTIRSGQWMNVSTFGDEVTVTSTPPIIYYNRVRYPYGQQTFVSPVNASLTDSRTYTVVPVGIDELSEGTIVSILTPSFIGPTLASVIFEFRPYPRRTEPVSVRFNLETTGPAQNVPVEVVAYPNKVNVYDKEYVNGIHSDSSLGMYDPLVDPGTLTYTQYEGGGNITLPSSAIAIAANIQDNLIFYALQGSDWVYWLSYSTGASDKLFEVNSITGQWTSGATITDLEYDEKNSLLYVLPNAGDDNMLVVPVMPFETQVNDIVLGPIASRRLPYASDTEMYSVAVSQNSDEVYFAAKPNASSEPYIYSCLPNGITYEQVAEVVAPISSSRPVSIMIGSRGTLYMQMEQDKMLRRANIDNTLESGLTDLYVLPEYLASMSRNCYGQFPS